MSIFLIITLGLIILGLFIWIKSLQDAIVKTQSVIDSLVDTINERHRNLKYEVDANSSDIETLEDANDDEPFKNRVLEVIQDHLEENAIKYLVLKSEKTSYE